MSLHNYFALLFIIFSCILSYTSSEFRIVEGYPWTIEQSPFLVSINYTNKNRCVGSLVTLQKVLTAASCVAYLPERKFIVAAGVTNLGDIPSAGQTRKVARVMVPSRYDFLTNAMDIAMLILRETFDWSNRVQTIPICGTPSGRDLQIYGWGWTTPKNGMTTNILQSTVLTEFSRQTCMRRYKKAGINLAPSMTCAAKGKSDACNEDFGGPGVVNGELCAVVSHNRGCASFDYPTIFTTLHDKEVREFVLKAIDIPIVPC